MSGPSPRERRIGKELMDIRNDKDNSGVFAQPLDEANLLHLKGSFPAPPDTPYAGGLYEVDIKIPDSYPFKSPTIKFITKIWHPNVSSQTVSVFSIASLWFALFHNTDALHCNWY